MLGGGLAGVDSDDAAARRVLVGVKPEHRSLIAEEVVHGVELADERLYDRVLRTQRFEVHLVDRTSAFGDLDEKIATVLGDRCARAPLWVLGCLEDQRVFGLGRRQ